MRRVPLLIACLLQSLTVFAQTPDPKKYNSYKFNQLIYSQNFNDPKDTNWVDIDSTDLTSLSTIKSGRYYYSIANAIQANPIDLKIDETHDFQIEFQAKVDKKNRRDSHGILMWGRKDNSSFMGNYWYFHRDGRDLIFNCTEVEASCNDKHKVKAHINKHEFNKYTIRKVGSIYYFFVNQQLVFQWPFVPLYGAELGLGAGSYSKKPVTIVYDYLRVAYLE